MRKQLLSMMLAFVSLMPVAFAKTTLNQVALPGSLVTPIEWATAVGGFVVFGLLLWKAWRDRNASPASPYLGMPMVVVTLLAILIAAWGDKIDLGAFTLVFEVPMALILKIVMTTLFWPFLFAALVVIPFSHIYPKLKEAFG